MSQLGLSDSFEYLCYESTAITNTLNLSAELDFRSLNLTKTDSDIDVEKTAPHCHYKHY